MDFDFDDVEPASSFNPADDPHGEGMFAVKRSF